MTCDPLVAALDYAAAGYRVHPCRPEDKRPLTRWGTAASTTPALIRAWWDQWPDALIGLCTGNGLVVVDDDRGLAEPDGDLAATRTSRTRSRGWHHYFQSSEPIGCAVGIIPGIDIRGEGGYVIAPPSPGWVWENDHAVLELPEWIVGAFNSTRKRRSAAGFEPVPASSIGEGYRHDYMVRFAGWAIRALEIEDAGSLAAVCLEEYQRACHPADAPDENIRRIARSVLRMHERNSRG